MDPQVVELISTIGFPIVACCALWWFTNTTCKELLEMLQKNNQMLEIVTGYFLGDKDKETKDANV